MARNRVAEIEGDSMTANQMIEIVNEVLKMRWPDMATKNATWTEDYLRESGYESMKAYHEKTARAAAKALVERSKFVPTIEEWRAECTRVIASGVNFQRTGRVL